MFDCFLQEMPLTAKPIRSRNQLLTESKQKEEELKSVNLEIEERAVSKKGPFVLIRNKNNKCIIVTGKQIGRAHV